MRTNRVFLLLIMGSYLLRGGSSVGSHSDGEQLVWSRVVMGMIMCADIVELEVRAWTGWAGWADDAGAQMRGSHSVLCCGRDAVTAGVQCVACSWRRSSGYGMASGRRSAARRRWDDA